MKCPCEECLKLSMCITQNRLICQDTKDYLFYEVEHAGVELFNRNTYVRHNRMARYMSLIGYVQYGFKTRKELLQEHLKEVKMPIKVRFAHFVHFWYMEVMIIGFRAYDWLKLMFKRDTMRDI